MGPETEKKLHIAMWAAFLVFLFLAPYSLFNFISVIEGNWEIEKGEEGGFEIGMTQEECFKV